MGLGGGAWPEDAAFLGTTFGANRDVDLLIEEDTGVWECDDISSL